MIIENRPSSLPSENFSYQLELQPNNSKIQELENPQTPPSNNQINQNIDFEEICRLKLAQYYEALHQIKTNFHFKRTKQQPLNFILHLTTLLLVTILNYATAIDPIESKIKYTILCISMMFSSLYSVATILFEIGWKDFLAHFFSLDIITLTIVDATISGYSFFNILSLNESWQTFVLVMFPIWLFTLGGTIKVQVTYYKWEKHQIIICKLFYIISMFFYLLISYKYLSNRFYKQFSVKNYTCFKNSILLYSLSHALMLYISYRTISRFDGTFHLQYFYTFQNELEGQIRKKQNKLHNKYINKQIN